MATVKRCDRCKEIIENPGSMKEIIVKGMIRPTTVVSFDLCYKCYGKLFSFEFMEQPLDQMDEMLKED